MVVQNNSNNKSYLNARDLDALYANRKDKSLSFDEWLIQKHRKGHINNDKRGNFLTN